MFAFLCFSQNTQPQLSYLYIAYIICFIHFHGNLTYSSSLDDCIHFDIISFNNIIKLQTIKLERKKNYKVILKNCLFPLILTLESCIKVESIVTPLKETTYRGKPLTTFICMYDDVSVFHFSKHLY